MTGHRIIVFRSWHRDDGRKVHPNVVTGCPKSGVPVWHADCVTCGRTLGVYGSELEARRAKCPIASMRTPDLTGLPKFVATARNMWLAGFSEEEIADAIHRSPGHARNIATGFSPIAHKFDAEQRSVIRRLRAEAVKIRRREAA